MKKIFILSILTLLLLSCSDETSETGELFSLEVVDSTGNPVTGLLVDVNNAFSNGQWGGRPVTSIGFVIAEASNIKLEIFNLQDELVRTLIDDDLYVGGHSIVWNGLNNNDEQANIGGTNIFRIQMTAIDTASNEILFQESKYMCMEVLLYSYLSRIGSTDEEGRFIFENELAFPHLFNPGEQPKYDEDACYCGTFILSDSINIKLTDPETEEYLVFTVKMGSSKHNHYDLVWENPQSGDKKAEMPEKYSKPVVIERDEGDDEVPYSFELRQNYPNPFN